MRHSSTRSHGLGRRRTHTRSRARVVCSYAGGGWPSERPIRVVEDRPVGGSYRPNRFGGYCVTYCTTAVTMTGMPAADSPGSPGTIGALGSKRDCSVVPTNCSACSVKLSPFMYAKPTTLRSGSL